MLNYQGVFIDHFPGEKNRQTSFGENSGLLTAPLFIQHVRVTGDQ